MKKLEFTIQTTPLGKSSGMDSQEIVRLDDNGKDNFTIHDTGSLVFVVDNKIIVYAPGTWGMVTSENQE